MSQVSKLYDLLKDYEWHTTDQILSVVYGASHLGIARISARIFDMRKKYLVEVESEPGQGTLWKYRLKKSLNQQSLFEEV